MKKVVGFMLSAALICGFGGGANALVNARGEEYVQSTQSFENKGSIASKSSGLELHAKSSYLMDYGTKTVIHAQNELVHLPIASMCKIMTLLLSFEAIDDGALTMEEEICVSERAASMGGSQVFLEANAKYPVKELIKSIVVCSANDSCLAMAERIAGSEALFVEKMNQKAKSLGANDTLFSNCTGLPKDPQYSCAKDVATMLRELLSHEEYYAFGKVWMDKFAHPQGRYTEISNTNKLVRFYDGCDGGKTGFTNEAGFCLAATAKRENMRVISVVIGEENSKTRFNDVRTMFDYAFANYTQSSIVKANEALTQFIAVQGGKAESVAVYPERNAYLFTKRGEKANVTMEMRAEKLVAPIEKDERAGELLVFKDGVEIDRIPLRTVEGVTKASVFDKWKDIARNWNAK